MMPTPSVDASLRELARTTVHSYEEMKDTERMLRWLATFYERELREDQVVSLVTTMEWYATSLGWPMQRVYAARDDRATSVLSSIVLLLPERDTK